MSFSLPMDNLVSEPGWKPPGCVDRLPTNRAHSAPWRHSGSMGTTRDLVASTLVDSLLPYMERALEDVIYEVLDRRRVPTKTDLDQLRERQAKLESQVGVLRKRVAELEAAQK